MSKMDWFVFLAVYAALGFGLYNYTGLWYVGLVYAVVPFFSTVIWSNIGLRRGHTLGVQWAQKELERLLKEQQEKESQLDEILGAYGIKKKHD